MNIENTDIKDATKRFLFERFNKLKFDIVNALDSFQDEGKRIEIPEGLNTLLQHTALVDILTFIFCTGHKKGKEYSFYLAAEFYGDIKNSIEDNHDQILKEIMEIKNGN